MPTGHANIYNDARRGYVADQAFLRSLASPAIEWQLVRKLISQMLLASLYSFMDFLYRRRTPLLRSHFFYPANQ